MQKFFSNKKLIVLMVALLVSVGLMFTSMSVRNNKNTPPLVQQIGNDIVGIGGRIVAAPGNFVKYGLDDVNDLLNTYQENRLLKAQVSTLAQTKVTNQTLQAENRSLKKQLKLDATLTDYSQITATVMMRSPSDWRNIVVINKGQGAGVAKGMPVMAGSGLVGRVVEVEKTNAKVEMMTTDNKSADRFAAQITTSNGSIVNGVISSYSAAKNELVLGQVSTEDNIKKGQRVVTSGLGGSTPKGLFIGTVASVAKDDFGLANTVYVKPAANFNDLSVVTVINRTIKGE
ncbi:rod shape-determining protein MreC [Lacticaseibacillus camelliae]|uniref:Cell shape-determining protein MreC n=1 Tax=Lacticaseibacillus camelliae DSM 22697 = JCM 13995 TaxID=1423730 RepID=A0A0R2FB18_9LACO|nr:rod shape-determining protein MreC [Lacticaseibacillus camelliae]KRN25599.1 rod shape-determining protein MreC [Lacticaseibacillus camelliae DSM 22697 = JCM 13995]